MKRIILIILLFMLLLEGVALAALTYDETYYMQHLAYLHSGSSITDPMYLFINESIGYLEGTTALTKLYFDPQSTAPTSPSEGTLYYRDSGDTLVLRTASAWVTLDTAGASSLDTAYGISAAVTVDAGAITLTATNAANNAVLALVQSDTGTSKTFTLTNAGTGNTIDIQGQASSKDIEGTGDTWNVSSIGVATLVGATISTSDLTFNEVSTDTSVIRSDTAQELEIASGSEDVSFGFGTSDTLTMSSDTGVVAMDFGSLVTVSGISTLTGSTASDLTIQVTSDTASEDLVIQQLGSGAYSVEILSAGTGTDSILIQATKGIDIDAVDDLNIRNTASTDADDFHVRLEGEHDASLILSSDGTGTDALSLLTDDSSGSGDIDVTSGDDIDINAADNITVDTSDGSYTLTAAGSILGDVTLSVADDYANTVAGHYALAVTGSVTITTTSDTASAIYLRENAGTTGTILIRADQGTSVTEGAASVEILSDAGGVEIRSTANLANAIALTVDSGTTSSILIFNDTGVSTTEGAASIELFSDLGSVELKSNLNGADAINIMTDGSTSSGIIVFNDSGTGDESIYLNSELGGITVKADAGSVDIEPTGGIAGDLGITVGDDMTTTIAGHHFETVTGSTTYTAGGITITSSGGAAGDIALVVGDDYTNTVTGDYTLAVTGTTTLGKIRYQRGVSITANAAVVLHPAMSGMVFVTTAATGTQTFTLPLAAVGLTFTFIDISTTGGDDLFILANTSDTINGGAAAEYYRSATDAVPASVTLVAINAVKWEVVAEVGTWTNSD